MSAESKGILKGGTWQCFPVAGNQTLPCILFCLQRAIDFLFLIWARCPECKYFCNKMTRLPMFYNLSFYSTVEVIHPKVSCLKSYRVKACSPTPGHFSFAFLNDIKRYLAHFNLHQFEVLGHYESSSVEPWALRFPQEGKICRIS